MNILVVLYTYYGSSSSRSIEVECSVERTTSGSGGGSGRVVEVAAGVEAVCFSHVIVNSIGSDDGGST